MYRNDNKTRLTDFDLMVIRAGGRTQSEVESSSLKWADIGHRVSVIFAGQLQRISAWLKERDIIASKAPRRHYADRLGQ